MDALGIACGIIGSGKDYAAYKEACNTAAVTPLTEDEFTNLATV